MNVLLKQLAKLQNLYLSFCVDLPGTSFNLISSLTLVFLLLLGHRYVLIHNIHRWQQLLLCSIVFFNSSKSPDHFVLFRLVDKVI